MKICNVHTVLTGYDVCWTQLCSTWVAYRTQTVSKQRTQPVPYRTDGTFIPCRRAVTAVGDDRQVAIRIVVPLVSQWSQCSVAHVRPVRFEAARIDLFLA